MNASVESIESTVRSRVAAARRIVIKMGTNVIMRDDGSVSIGVLYGIAESLANLVRIYDLIEPVLEPGVTEFG